MADYCVLLGYNVMLSLLRNHKDWNDELVAKMVLEDWFLLLVAVYFLIVNTI